MHNLVRLLVMHHRVGPRRQELDVGAGVLQELQMRLERGVYLLVADLVSGLALAASTCQQIGLIGVKTLRRRHVGVHVDDHDGMFLDFAQAALAPMTSSMRQATPRLASSCSNMRRICGSSSAYSIWSPPAFTL